MAEGLRARGRRLEFDALPASVADQLATVLGGRVVTATTQPSGFSPGVAARVVTEHGARYFVKAVSGDVNAHSVRLHRREAEVLGALGGVLGAHVAQLVGVVDEPPWFALVIDDVEGRQPGDPWTDDDLDAVLACHAEVLHALTPPPDGFHERAGDALQKGFGSWSTFEPARAREVDPWIVANLDRLRQCAQDVDAAAAGATLLHLDVRSDNLLLTAAGARLIDWPHVAVGHPLVDLVLFAPTVEMEGGPSAAEVLARSAWRDADPARVATLVAAWSGMLAANCLEPDPPGLPDVRAFQRAQARVALRWLREIWGEEELQG